MDKLMPKKNSKLLNSIVGKRVIGVVRQIFEGDLSREYFEETADGPTELIFETGESIYFLACTEQCSVGVVQGKMPVFGESYSEKNVEGSSFWQSKVGKKVTGVEILSELDVDDSYPCQFGVELEFENGEKAIFEYISDEENQDMMRIVPEIVGREFTRSSCENES